MTKSLCIHVIVLGQLPLSTEKQKRARANKSTVWPTRGCASPLLCLGTEWWPSLWRNDACYRLFTATRVRVARKPLRTALRRLPDVARRVAWMALYFVSLWKTSCKSLPLCCHSSVSAWRRRRLCRYYIFYVQIQESGIRPELQVAFYEFNIVAASCSSRFVPIGQ